MELSEQFQYGPAFKNKENSQGTLFRPAKKGAMHDPVKRLPRGFTNERRNEVGKAIGLMWQYPGNKEHPPAIRWDLDKKDKQAAADVINTVARSTAPVAHMKNLNTFIKDKDAETGGYYNKDHDLGEGHSPVNQAFRYKNASMGIRGAGMHIAPGSERDNKTAIHELGHHANLYHGVDPASDWGEGLTHGNMNRGYKEGFADRYAEEHAREPGYKRQKPLPYDWSSNPADEGWSHYFEGTHGTNHRKEAHDDFNWGYSRGKYPLENTTEWDAHKVLQDKQFAGAKEAFPGKGNFMDVEDQERKGQAKLFSVHSNGREYVTHNGAFTVAYPPAGYYEERAQ